MIFWDKIILFVITEFYIIFCLVQCISTDGYRNLKYFWKFQISTRLWVKLLTLVSEKYLNHNSSKLCIYFGIFRNIKNISQGHKTLKKFDRDSNLKICLLPGLEVQKVEKHWSSSLIPNQGIAAFTCTDLKSAKNTVNLSVLFTLFGICACKSWL